MGWRPVTSGASSGPDASRGSSLAGTIVVEAGEGIATAYAGKLLRDQGACVFKAERAGGDPLRRWSAAVPDKDGGGALYGFLNDGKLDLDGTNMQTADIILAGSHADLLLGPDWRSATSNGCVVVNVSPFGDSGPLTGRPATEFTLQAWCGLMSACGTRATPPLQMGVGPGAWATGATAALAALAGRAARGRVTVEVAALEVMAVCLTNYPALYAQLTGRVAAISRGGDWPSVVQCKDGWIGLCVFTPQQWADFAAAIGRADLASDERLNSMAGRSRNRELAESVIRPWLADHTAAEIQELGELFRVPVAPIGNGSSVLEMAHFNMRGAFVENPAGFRQPRSPLRITTAPAPASPREKVASRRPLAGIVVLDLTAFWAGPYASHLLASLGADVVKIESPRRPDGMRFATVVESTDPNWMEFSPTFHGTNPGKRSVAIDFATPAGRDLVMRLVEHADVLVENFTPRVLGNAGLDEAALRTRRRDLILLRMPGFGLDGPWSSLPGFAQTMEQVSGIAWLTGTSDVEPIVRTSVDPIAGIHAAFAVLAALEHRRRFGEGALIEVSMAEVALNIAAESIVTWSADGVLLGRDGNRGRGAAPQGVYACTSHGPAAEQWVALSVETDVQWRALVGVLGRPSWATAPELAGRAGRRARHDDLDVVLSEWFASRERDETVETLLASGVPAAPVWDHQDQLPHLAARGFYQTVDHPLAGAVHQPGIGLRSDDLHVYYPGPAPLVGQHTADVLHTLLGLTDEELESLAAAGAIAI
jgi:crotonobetainyl-CoA:carnitine CoA-transferase CaiB-like acyl-CoA transferase